MRVLLLIAVVLLGIDAVAYSGAYSQTVWRAASNQVRSLQERYRAGSVAERPGDTR